MYTATKLGDSVDKQTRRRTVTVLFSDGTSEFEKDFSFSIETELIAMKKIVKDYLDEINFVVPALSDGEIDFTGVGETDIEKQGAEARVEWEDSVTKLKKVTELVQLGVIEPTNPKLLALTNKVKTTLKAEYLN